MNSTSCLTCAHRYHTTSNIICSAVFCKNPIPSTAGTVVSAIHVKKQSNRLPGCTGCSAVFCKNAGPSHRLPVSFSVPYHQFQCQLLLQYLSRKSKEAFFLPALRLYEVILMKMPACVQDQSRGLKLISTNIEEKTPCSTEPAGVIRVRSTREHNQAPLNGMTHTPWYCTMAELLCMAGFSHPFQVSIQVHDSL